MLHWLRALPWMEAFFFTGVVGVILSVAILVFAFRTIGDDRPWSEGSVKDTLIFVAYLLLSAFFCGLVGGSEE